MIPITNVAPNLGQRQAKLFMQSIVCEHPRIDKFFTAVVADQLIHCDAVRRANLAQNQFPFWNPGNACNFQQFMRLAELLAHGY